MFYIVFVLVVVIASLKTNGFQNKYVRYACNNKKDTYQGRCFDGPDLSPRI